MRVLRDCLDCVCAAVLPSCPPMTQHRSVSLEDVGNLWTEWGIHGLILVSFGLQVFLFFAAGLRRRSISRILRSFLWLAYLSADSVAIFILGHLSVHASGPSHHLLFFWAPFVLLHLGGQHTITAFSMQDNELWRRHLLGLVTQVVVAGYVVSRSSWPDKRLLAAMVLMFLSGCLRYAERILCLYNASPAKLKESSLAALKLKESSLAALKLRESSLAALRRRHEIGDATGKTADDNQYNELIIDVILNADGKRPPFYSDYMITSIAVELVSETPLSHGAGASASPSFIQSQLQELRSSADRCRAYNYVGTRLVHVYELLYTKAPLHYYFIDNLGLLWPCFPNICEASYIYVLWCCLAFALVALPFLSLIVLFPFLSTTSTMVLFVVAKKSQLYSQADVIVSYILLIGAITLEVASLFITFALGQEAPRRVRNAIWSVAKYIHPAWGTKQWSEMLGQYNMINSLVKQDDAGIMSFVPEWIGKHLDDKTITHIHIYEDLKKFVLDKLLEFGTRQEDWNFASFRGQIALRDWKSSHGLLSPAGSETTLNKSINDMNFPTSVLIWHIATDMLYFQDNNTNGTNSCQRTKKMSREISNYIMYLVFKYGVMLTNTTEVQHDGVRTDMKARGLGTMKEVFQASQLQMNTSETPIHPLLSHACKVAEELIDIHEEANRWKLIADVWLEMLFYTAPRCGGAFHSDHLTTGGEFITHVLLLMQLLGPFVKPSGM